MEEKKERKASYRKGHDSESIRNTVDEPYKVKADFNCLLNRKGFIEYDQRIIPHVIEMFREGLSKTAVCTNLGISRQTMGNWRRRYKDFDAICEIGETAVENYWDNIGIKNISNKELNTQVYLFFASKFRVVEKEEREDENMAILKKMSEDFDKLKKEYEKEY